MPHYWTDSRRTFRLNFAERLVFVKGANDSARHPKMRALLRKVGDQIIRRRFESIPELNALVYASLVDYLAASGAVRTKPFDASGCTDAKLGDLSRKRFSEFLARAKTERGYPLGPRTPMRKALIHLNLLDGSQPTHAAILLFGRQPQRFLISSEVKCLHFHGTEIQKPIPDYHIFKGTVFELVEQALDFVMAKIACAVGTRAESSRAPVTYELPRLAVTEAIVNAVAHRDYASNASVQVMLFSDRLEVWNPGQLPPPLTPESLRRPHPSIPRNPLIAEPLFLTRYIEKAGTGILDMIQLCKAAGVPAPTFRQEGGIFVQSLTRPKTTVASQPAKVGSKVESKVGSKVESLPTRILNSLLAAALAKTEIAKAVGRQSVDGQLHSEVNKLLAQKLITRTILGKPTSRLQKYRLTKMGRTWFAKRKP